MWPVRQGERGESEEGGRQYRRGGEATEDDTWTHFIF